MQTKLYLWNFKRAYHNNTAHSRTLLNVWVYNYQYFHIKFSRWAASRYLYWKTITTEMSLHVFHHVTSFCSNILLTDPPEHAHLPDDQPSSVESFSAPLQVKMVCLKCIPIPERIQRSTGLSDFHLFLHWRLSSHLSLH